jgi:vacuolar protein sorting-associated protein 35
MSESRQYPVDDEDDALHTGVSHEEKQKSLLSEAKNVVNAEAYRMRRALDKNQLEEALKHSAKMLNQLRTSDLSPKNYYDLCMLYTLPN